MVFVSYLTNLKINNLQMTELKPMKKEVMITNT